MVSSSLKSEFMSGTAFDGPSGLHQIPCRCEASGWRLRLPEMEIEIAIRLFHRHRTPHNLAARSAGNVDAIGVKSHDRTMAGRWQMASRNLPRHPLEFPILRFSNRRVAFWRKWKPRLFQPLGPRQQKPNEIQDQGDQ